MTKENQTKDNKKKLNTALFRILKASGIAVACHLLMTSSAFACGSGIADTTTYFLPHVDDYCADGYVCQDFRTEIRMQGSGRLRSSHVYRYTGTKTPMPDCETTTGAAGRCLIPYVSVAADPSKYKMGAIIAMPALRGHWMTLPNGRKFRHPGYMRVDDTGGAILGKGRFDLFTGYYNPSHEENTFGYDGDFKMSSLNACPDYKAYEVLVSGSKFEAANRAIDKILQTATNKKASLRLLTSRRPRPNPNRFTRSAKTSSARPAPRAATRTAPSAKDSSALRSSARPLPRPQGTQQ